MTSAGTDIVDLVCGPDGPLPEGRQRYRLMGRLGSGGQADVFRGVRLSHGVKSSPVTVKVFRAGDDRPVLDQMRSWDKGDAVLMDLNTRSVSGICLRVDGFYGAPPIRPDSTAVLGADTDRRIPYQVLDYLPGHTLLQHVARQANGDQLPRLDGLAVLTTLAKTVTMLHHPVERGESPVLHMDVKPSNVLVLPSTEIKLIDFTGARYHNPVHITTIAHTPESAGPEAFTGTVGPSYDVHGFGSVAFHLVTGWLPRADRATSQYDGSLAEPGSLRRHPVLDGNPRLAAHLLAPLDDNPANRPLSVDLVSWVSTLAQICASIPAAGTHVGWGSTEQPRRSADRAAPDRTRVERAPGPYAASAAVPAAPSFAPSGPSAPSYGEPQAAGYAAPSAPGGYDEPQGPSYAAPQPPGYPAPQAPNYNRVGNNPPATRPFDRPLVDAPASPAAGGQVPGAAGQAKIPSGVARVVPKQQKHPAPTQDDAQGGRYAYRPASADSRPGRPGQPPQQAPEPDPYEPPHAPEQRQPSGPVRRKGKNFMVFATVVAAATWLLWLATVAFIPNADTGEPVTAAVLVTAGAFAVWWGIRLGGYLIRSTLNWGSRRSTLVQNIATAAFILLCASVFFTRAVSNFSDVGAAISDWWDGLWDWLPWN